MHRSGRQGHEPTLPAGAPPVGLEQQTVLGPAAVTCRRSSPPGPRGPGRAASRRRRDARPYLGRKAAAGAHLHAADRRAPPRPASRGTRGTGAPAGGHRPRAPPTSRARSAAGDRRRGCRGQRRAAARGVAGPFAGAIHRSAGYEAVRRGVARCPLRGDAVGSRSTSSAVRTGGIYEAQIGSGRRIHGAPDSTRRRHCGPATRRGGDLGQPRVRHPHRRRQRHHRGQVRPRPR